MFLTHQTLHAVPVEIIYVGHVIIDILLLGVKEIVIYVTQMELQLAKYVVLDIQMHLEFALQNANLFQILKDHIL